MSGDGQVKKSAFGVKVRRRCLLCRRPWNALSSAVANDIPFSAFCLLRAKCK